MNFLIVANSPDYPEGLGYTRRIRTIAEGMSQRGHNVKIMIAHSEQTPKRLIHNDTEIYRIRELRSDSILQKLLLLPGTISGANSETSRFDPDVVYLYYTPPYYGIPILMRALRENRIVVADFPDIPPSSSSILKGLKIKFESFLREQAYARWCHGIVTISNYLNNKFQAKRVRTFKLPPLIRRDELLSASPNHEGNVDGPIFNNGDTRTVLYLGSFNPYQGVEVLIQAFSELCQCRDKLRLALVGATQSQKSQAHKSHYRSLINELGIEHAVDILPSVEPDGVPQLLQSADVLVIPKLETTVNKAGFSSKIPEYLGSGTPVVASRIGDLAEVAEDGKHVFFFEPGDASNLADKIGRLLDDPSLAEAMRKHARELVLEEFETQVNLQQFEDFLYSLHDSSTPQRNSSAQPEEE